MQAHLNRRVDSQAGEFPRGQVQERNKVQAQARLLARVREPLGARVRLAH